MPVSSTKNGSAQGRMALRLRYEGSKFANIELTSFVDSQFHVDNLSSAHIYLRMTPDQKWNQLPPALLEDCAQLTKANSIEGINLKFLCLQTIYAEWQDALQLSRPPRPITSNDYEQVPLTLALSHSLVFFLGKMTGSDPNTN